MIPDHLFRFTTSGFDDKLVAGQTYATSRQIDDGQIGWFNAKRDRTAFSGQDNQASKVERVLN